MLSRSSRKGSNPLWDATKTLDCKKNKKKFEKGIDKPLPM